MPKGLNVDDLWNNKLVQALIKTTTQRICKNIENLPQNTAAPKVIPARPMPNASYRDSIKNVIDSA